MAPKRTPEELEQQRKKQKLRKANARKEKMADPAYVEAEKARKAAAARKRRENTLLRQQEREADKAARRQSRTDSEIRQAEQEANTAAHRQRRADSEIRQAEQEANTAAHRQRRTDSEIRQAEQEADTAAHRQRRLRADANRAEIEARKERENNRAWASIYDKFLESVMEGPIHSCYSCDRLFFKRSITKTSKSILINKPGTSCTEDWLKNAILQEYFEESEWNICGSCWTHIKKKNPTFPKLNINNSNLKFHQIHPTIASLRPLERRLVSPRIPFMKIFALGCDRQYGIRGGIVNVPVNVSHMFEAIPINPNQANVIHLKLKRKINYQNDYIYERIRPKLVYEAAKILCETPLYKNNEPPITLHQEWGLQDQEEVDFNTDAPVQSSSNIENSEVADSEVPMETDEADQENNHMETDDQQNPADDEENENYIHFDEETFMDNSNAVAFAPGEGEIPLPMWLDVNCEELAFPHIFGGHPREVNELSYVKTINSEIRRTDRRAAEPDHLLFAHKKAQLKQLSNSINIQMKKATQNNVTASVAKTQKFVDQSIANDNAFRTLQTIVGSPPYWEQQKKNVLAMVRQYGICSFFVTLSAAETKWKDLLKILMKTVDKVDASDADVESLTFEKKAELIRKDPVTCALYFDHRFKQVKSTWFKTLEGPFNNYKINHMYHRIEFQHRGSPHVHMLVWLENAPQYNPNNTDNMKDIIDCIDSIVSTDSEDPDVKDFIAYQKHRCTKTCRKTNRRKTRCRFGAPFPPMKQTTILTPLDVKTLDEKDQEKVKEIVQKLAVVLDSNTMTSFDELFNELKCDDDSYIKAIRTTLNVNKVLVKRAVKDHRVNPYSKKIMMCMQSNMDIQFVLDPYACINYIVEYINKPARGISRLLKTCVENIKAGNSSLHNQLKCVCNCFYNGSEISAQEAAWCRCGLLMSVCSVAVEFINTSRPDKRHRMLKSNAELVKLAKSNPDSRDIFKPGMIDRYVNRPKNMELTCYADFIACYSFKGKGKLNSNEQDPDEESVPTEEVGEVSPIVDDANEDAEISGSNNKIKLNDGSTLTRRKNPKVIRFCRFDIRKDAVEFFRERLMLFKPWRDEEKELENVNHKEVYNQSKDLIEENSKKFIKLDVNIDDMLQEIEELQELENTESWDEETDPAFVNVYEPDENTPESNILFDVGEEGSIQVEAKKYSLPDMLSNDDYYDLCDSLNIKQRDYLMHIINCFKSSDDPQYHFVTGGAGTGKSRLIKAVYQSLVRHFRKDAGPAGNPEVLLVAPTGKAAHNIGGVTAHHAFNLKFGANNSSEGFTPPAAEKLNSMRTKLADLKVVIIDEISMMGTSTLQKIHSTLNVVYKNNNPDRIFGGRSVIVLGDFNQLQPVKDDFCFMPSEKNPLNVIAGKTLWEHFTMFELTQIMRQREDTAFAEALNRLAIGCSTEKDMTMFNSRVYTEASLPEEGKQAVRLAWTNQEVEKYNTLRVQQLKTHATKSTIHRAIDVLPNNITNQEKAQMIQNLKGKPAAETQGLPEKLLLQTGVHYMVTSNIDVEDGLFNGAIGVLKKYVTHPTRNTVVKVFLDFESPTIGKNARSKHRQTQLSPEAQAESELNSTTLLLTPLVPSKMSFAVTRKYHNQVMRHQFPLVIAEAITIHKSQGSTFEKITIQIPQQNRRSLIYVALSRATKLENLYLVGKALKKTKPPQSDDKIVKEMNRLKTEAVLIPKFIRLHEVPNNCIQIVSHNIRSLSGKHINTVRNDPVFTESHMMLLQETWVAAETSIAKIGIPEKSIITRNMLSGKAANGKGTIIYGIENLSMLNYVNFDRDQTCPIDMTVCCSEKLSIINMYRSKSATTDQLKAALFKIRNYLSADNVLLCGDFNYNLALQNSQLKNTIKIYDLELLSPIQPTTDSNTTIDGVFGRLKNFNFNIYIYESYCSDHKPLIIRLTEKEIEEVPSTGLSQTLQVLNV